mmetsp:Transcript_17912/g.19969  ORF Transcript_17912/g.19969 Transcript_17912/m.19969 type:complete len:133 (+) Transcript_17912:71-469(+)
MLTKLLPLIILCGFPLLLLSIPLRITARKSLLLSSLNKNNFKQNEKINNNLMTIKRITPSLKIRGGGFVEEEEDYDDDYDDDDDLITTNIDSSSSSSSISVGIDFCCFFVCIDIIIITTIIFVATVTAVIIN